MNGKPGTEKRAAEKPFLPLEKAWKLLSRGSLGNHFNRKQPKSSVAISTTGLLTIYNALGI